MTAGYTDPNLVYDLLIDYASTDVAVERLVMGQVWTVCQLGANCHGLAMTPPVATRTLPWAGTLRGQPASRLVEWIRSWDWHQACVGMSVINAALNRFPQPATEQLPAGEGPANLAVFEHLLPRIQDKKVVVIGRYPGLERYENRFDLQVIERTPGAEDFPDSACEYLLPAADWVFITSSSLTNKTFPRLARLAENATTVLMGPTTPWLPELYHFGVNYLAGVTVNSNEDLWQTASEGGGVRIFDSGVSYRLLELTAQTASDWTKKLISQTITEKEQLKLRMAAWYERGEAKRFPQYQQLERVNARLSRLDTCYKTLWDNHPGQLTEPH